jgi:hypothetical protein
MALGVGGSATAPAGSAKRSTPVSFIASADIHGSSTGLEKK